MLEIPSDRAANHGGQDFYASGAKFAETLELWGGLRPGDRVLDIGCGPGRMAIGIGERFGWNNSLVGFDVIEVDVQVCRDHITSVHSKFQFHHINVWNSHYNPGGDVQDRDVVFPAESGSIGFALATSVFTHMFREGVTRYLNEAYRVLEPGGRLLTTWFAVTEAALKHEGRRFRFAHRHTDGCYFEKPHRPEDVVGFAYQDIMDMVTGAGFQSIAFYQGGWSRTATSIPKPRHNQDVLVCLKPRS